MPVMVGIAKRRQKAMAPAACCRAKSICCPLTWNAPIEAFTRPGDFFEGQGVDGVYLHFRKANEFLGMAALPTFICTDVMKNPQVPQYLTAYTAHLKQVFGLA